MQQTSIPQIESAVGPTPFYSMDAALPEETAMPDNELFIRRAFEQDARLGCELLFRRCCLFPIPQTERDVNPALDQNPGY